jgi:hypothetical protein
MTSSDALEVWFLTGSQGLYGEGTLRQVAEQSRATPAARRTVAGCAAGGRWCPPPCVRRAASRSGPSSNKDRNTVERCINKIKEWRGLVTRYDKTPTSYLAGLHTRRRDLAPQSRRTT